MFYLLLICILLLLAIVWVKPNKKKRTQGYAVAQATSRPWIIAHRGASGLYPENTYAAFDAAVESGADFLELDLQLTKDGQLAVIHDSTLDRTTNGKGEVSGFTMEELQEFDAGSWKDRRFQGERIPVFKDVLQKYGTVTGMLIEVKPTENRGKMASELAGILAENLGANSRQVIIQSFDEAFLLEFKKRMPSIPLGVLIRHQANGIKRQTIRRLAADYSFINPKITMADVKLINDIKAENAKCLIWTVNNKKKGQALLSLNPAGIITNYPEWFT